MYTKNIAIDVGFGFVKATDGTQRYIFPSVVGEARDIRYKSGMGNDKVLDNLVVEIDDDKYFVGNLANRQSEFLISTQSQERVKSFENKVLFNTAISLLDGPGTGVSGFNLVTGLPVDEYKEYKNMLKEQLQGNHVVKLVNNGHVDGKKVRINQTRVIPQPFGTVFNKLLTDSGQVAENKYAAARVGVVDIGFRTTDFVVANNLEFIDKSSKTSKTAMSSAYNMVSRKLSEEYNIDKQIYQLENIVRNGGFTYGGDDINIDGLVKRAYSLVAQKIVSEINSLWTNLWEFDQLLVTGGGGIALYEYLKRLLDAEIDLLVDDGQFSNVSGYIKTANRSF